MDSKFSAARPGDAAESGNCKTSSIPETSQAQPGRHGTSVDALFTAGLHPSPIIRRRDMRGVTGLAPSTMHDRQNPRSPRYDPTFPKPIKLGERAVGFWRSEVLAWLQDRERA